MLSNISKYAISALSLIAKRSVQEEKTKVGEIAERFNIPQAFLSKILQKLTKVDYLSSLKGVWRVLLRRNTNESIYTGYYY